MPTTPIGYMPLHGFSIAKKFYHFINDEVLPGTGLDPDTFWRESCDLMERLAPINRRLLEHRDAMQRRIDAWHIAHPGVPDGEAYQAFLQEIGYLVPCPHRVKASTNPCGC